MKNERQNIKSNRSRVRTNVKRAVYDFKTIAKILDSSFVCHIGFVIENQPFIIPTCYGRENDKIFFHGAKGSRMLKHTGTGSEICIAVTKVDGIVLAKSAFHHSINYRSIAIFGIANEINDPLEKTNALKIISENILPRRWEDARKPNDKELNATSVFLVLLNEVSAKVREGEPIDEEEDKDLNIWSGVLPLKTMYDVPIKAEDLNSEITLPDYLKIFQD